MTIDLRDQASFLASAKTSSIQLEQFRAGGFGFASSNWVANMEKLYIYAAPWRKHVLKVLLRDIQNASIEHDNNRIAISQGLKMGSSFQDHPMGDHCGMCRSDFPLGGLCSVAGKPKDIALIELLVDKNTIAYLFSWFVSGSDCQ